MRLYESFRQIGRLALIGGLSLILGGCAKEEEPPLLRDINGDGISDMLRHEMTEDDQATSYDRILFRRGLGNGSFAAEEVLNSFTNRGIEGSIEVHDITGDSTPYISYLVRRGDAKKWIGLDYELWVNPGNTNGGFDKAKRVQLFDKRPSARDTSGDVKIFE